LWISNTSIKSNVVLELSPSQQDAIQSHDGETRPSQLQSTLLGHGSDMAEGAHRAVMVHPQDTLVADVAMVRERRLRAVALVAKPWRGRRSLEVLRCNGRVRPEMIRHQAACAKPKSEAVRHAWEGACHGMLYGSGLNV